MGFKSPWFQFLVLCLLCVSTVANSKPLSVKLTSEDCGESCSNAKEGTVHKIEARDVREDYTPKYRRASDTNHEELLDIDSLSDFDIEETDDDGGESSDELNSSGDGFRKSGGAHVDDSVDYGIDWAINKELPEKIIHDTVDDTSDDNPVVDDDDDTPRDDDDTFAADDDDTSGGHDDYADDFFDETQDNHDDDSDDNDHAPNSPDDDDDTFGVDVDADDYDSNAEEMLEDDDNDTHDDADGDVEHEINLPDDNDDTYDEVVNLDDMTETPNDDDDNHDDVVNLDHMTDTPNDDDADKFRVDDVVDDSIKLPDQTTDDDDVKVKGQEHVLEEHPHKSAKVTHHHNLLHKHPDSKLGRLLKKHHSNGMTSGKSGRKNLHEDIYDDDFEYNDFGGQKRKGKIPTHKGRRTLSLDENSDFEHAETDISGKDDQNDGGNSAEGNAENPDKRFSDSLGDVQKPGSAAETTANDKDTPALVQEDPIEGEDEEENQRANAANSVSDNEEGIKATYSTSENLTEENGQHYEEDKIEGEEEEEEENEVKVDDGSVLNSDRDSVIGKEELPTHSGDQDEMGLGA